jgi:hypothetical protein
LLYQGELIFPELKNFYGLEVYAIKDMNLQNMALMTAKFISWGLCLARVVIPTLSSVVHRCFMKSFQRLYRGNYSNGKFYFYRIIQGMILCS